MSFLYYLLVGISVTWLQTIDAWCPEDWNFAPGVGCYLTSDPSVQVQFDEARRICQQLGGSLVSVNEIAKRKAIENIMTDDWGHYWVGAEYNGTTKEFLWDNGSHLEKVKGRPLEGKRTCVTFRSIMKFPFGNDPITDDRNVLKFVLHADPCDIEQRFICEKRNVTVTPEPSTPPPTTPKPTLEPSSAPACEPKIITVTVTETLVSSIIVRPNQVYGILKS